MFLPFIFLDKSFLYDSFLPRSILAQDTEQKSLLFLAALKLQPHCLHFFISGALLKVFETFSLISFRLAFVLKPLAHLLEQKRPDPYDPSWSCLQFSQFFIDTPLFYISIRTYDFVDAGAGIEPVTVLRPDRL